MWKILFVLPLISFSLTLAQSQVDSIAVFFVHAFGKEGDRPGEFRHPSAIAIDANGNVYIADAGNHRVQKLDEKGVFQSMIGGFGWGREQFNRPLDVSADNGLDVFVADYENRRVERFDKDLHWISTYQSNVDEKEKLVLGFPASVALSRHGDLFIADAENRRILKLNTLRQAELSFGDYDGGHGALLSPIKVSISHDDRIFVTDRKAGYVIVYDYFGNFLQTIGDGLLKEPVGLCLDNNRSLVFISDVARHQVYIFDFIGRLISSIGGFGNKLGAFNYPTDVAVYKNLLYVTEANNHRVQIFRLQLVTRP